LRLKLRHTRILIASAALAFPSWLAAAGPLRIDCAFPGGNAVVESVTGDTVLLHQDLRDTEGWWFYWAFRVRGAAGRTLKFRFTNQKPVGVRGPAISLDGGATWNWAPPGSFDPSGFDYAFPAGAGDVRFSFTIPYFQTNLQEFLRKHRGDPHLQAGALCRSRKGRDVEQLRAGRLDGGCRYRILLTARHHACEALADYSLEGILSAVLADSEDGAWYRSNVEILAVPFMDKDGVEDGDQGKNRRPRDHNRDYAGESLYPEVRTLRQKIPEWSGGRLRIALDIHCPSVRGADHEKIHFVGVEDAEVWKQVLRLSSILEETARGPLPFRSSGNVPWGTSWNLPSNLKSFKSFALWASGLPGIGIATTVEIPYANALGGTVTAESARALGTDLARAMRLYLEQKKD
jgi:hypothetical protein